MDHYIRWGGIPPGGRSRNWRINSKKPRYHKGLSVYAVTWDEAKGKARTPGASPSASAPSPSCSRTRHEVRPPKEPILDYCI